jgi:cytochrome c oxidase subunit II
MILRALPMPPRSRHRAVAIVLAASLLLLLATAPGALADVFTPESGGSPNADSINSLYKITLYVGIVMFLIVEGTLIWTLVRYRDRRGGDEPEQIRGNTPLELGWTIGAAVILLVLTVITFVFLGRISDPPDSDPDGLGGGNQFAAIGQPSPPDGKALNISVNGQQFLWRYDYPGKAEVFSYSEMVVPVHTTVQLRITSSDVAHSWWIPELGGKADAIPGHVNETWFKIPKPGVYKGQCAELCGTNHAEMRARVRALPVGEYEAWVKSQASYITQSRELLSKQRAAREAPTQ